MGRGIIIAAIGAAGLSLTSNARAQDWKPDSHRSAAGADIYLWALPEADSFAAAPVGFVDVEPIDTFFIDAWLPWANIVSPDGAAVGNPSVQFRYAPKHGITRWWLGGGFAGPIASTVNEVDWFRGLAAGDASMAAYQSYLWLWGHFPLWITGGADVRVHRAVSIQVSGEPMFLPRIRGGGDDFEFAIQTKAGFEARDPASGIGGGAHLLVWWGPTFTNNNEQFTIKPFFGYTGDVFFLRFGLLFTLDAPYGPFFDRVFPQELTVGGQW